MDFTINDNENQNVMISPAIKGLSEQILANIKTYASDNSLPIFVLDAPLIESRYKGSYPYGCVILIPHHRLIFLDYGTIPGSEYFDNYVWDTLEDVGSISDRFNFKEIIGRPRQWKNLYADPHISSIDDLASFLKENRISVESDIRKVDYIISLFIGSVNDAKTAIIESPSDLLDAVKHKIMLFDCDQTRFIYGALRQEVKNYSIQGLSGTGKTELLLHKLKETYIANPEAHIGFTCYSKVLADKLKKRIPEFFNSMNVQQQIDWEDRLLCANSWGSNSDYRSGIYRYICFFYGLPFFSYRAISDFDTVCKKVVDELKARIESVNDNSEWKYAFQYLFIDESQDFHDSFFEMCDLVTEKTVYKAGDIFQSIFANMDDSADDIKGDLLLNKCYRTAPKTFMISQALGWGLFEKPKVRWLANDVWKTCGYQILNETDKTIELTRSPLKRFNDEERFQYNCFHIKTTADPIDGIVRRIDSLKNEYSSLQPDDICIIFIDTGKYVYDTIPRLKEKLYEKFGFESNIAYETKKVIRNQVFITNGKNVKGLEFPFVICYTNNIGGNLIRRNLIYTMLSRSLLTTYLLLPKLENGLNNDIKNGLKEILDSGKMTLKKPSQEELDSMQHRTFEVRAFPSLKDRITPILQTHQIELDKISEIMEFINNSPNIDIDDTEQLQSVVLQLKAWGRI